MLANHRRGLILAAVLLASSALLAALLAIPTTRAWIQVSDDYATWWAGAVRNQPATELAEVLSVIGSAWVTWPLRAVVAVVLAATGRLLQLAAFALAVVTSELLIGFAKNLYGRARPLDSLVETTGYSFPSGHAIAGAVTAVGLVIVLLPAGRSRLRWEVWAVVFTVVMALSRVYLQAHWLSDTVAGALLGAGIAIGWPAVLMALAEYRSRVKDVP